MKISLPFKFMMVAILCASSFAGGMWYTVTALDHASDSALTHFYHCEGEPALYMKVTPFWKEYGVECYFPDYNDSVSLRRDLYGFPRDVSKKM